MCVLIELSRHRAHQVVMRKVMLHIVCGVNICIVAEQGWLLRNRALRAFIDRELLHTFLSAFFAFAVFP